MSAAAPSQNFWPEIVSVCAMPDWYRAWPAASRGFSLLLSMAAKMLPMGVP